MKIAVDLGHGMIGGQDRGAVGVIAEETIIDEVGNIVISKLQALGHSVLETRPSNAYTVGDSLSQRVNASNNWGADLFVCIHANAGGGHGSEVFTHNGSEVAEARNVLNNLVALGFTNRGIKSESLYVINHTNAKAMLIEICFVDTQSDVDLYHSLGANRIADAIVKGIVGQTIEVSQSGGSSSPTQVISDVEKAKQFVGNRCAELQSLLIAKGYNCGGYGADGCFGQSSYDSLMQFQKDSGLVQDALAGTRTFEKLNESVTNVTQGSNWIARLQQECNNQGFSNQKVDGCAGQNTLSGLPMLRQGARGEITRILQERLNELGYSTNGIDGIFGGGMASGLASYQRNQGVSADSICGQGTWSKLLELS